MSSDQETGGTETPQGGISRRSFVAALLAGAASGQAFAKSAPTLKPVNRLSKAEATELLNSVDKDTLAVMVMLESGGDPNARNSKSNVWGAYQFLPSTAKSVGLDPAERGNPYLSLLGAARLQKDNSDFLRSAIGREPKPYEVYLAHQQGKAGAAALINGGSRKAVDVLAPLYSSRSTARDAIVNNGGKADISAADFVKVVAAFYNKSANSKYSFPAGKAWVAHVAQNERLTAEFINNDPYFAKRKLRETQRAQVKDPEQELRTYNEMKEFILIHPDSQFAKDFSLVTGFLNRVVGTGAESEKPGPAKKEDFDILRKFRDRVIGNPEKGKSPSR